MRKITDTNRNLKDEGILDIALGSMDVVALYPSLDQKESAAIVAEAIIESDIKYGHRGSISSNSVGERQVEERRFVPVTA